MHSHQLHDHTAHRCADDMRLFNAQRVKQRYAVLGHVCQRVGWLYGQAKARFDHCPDEIWGCCPVHALRQAYVAIVIMDHAIALRHQPLDQVLGPSNHLRPEPHDEQDHRTIG